jgi:hypothetical protein
MSNPIKQIKPTLTEDLNEQSIINNIQKLSLNSSPSKSKKSCNTITVLASNNVKPPLPINFDSNLPHINFDIGKTIKKSFKINIAYDTCAILNVGYAGKHLTIAKQFPSVVKNLTWAKKDFSPLILSGIVKEEDKKQSSPTQTLLNNTTTLPAVIEYFTPYKTKVGSPVTLKIALGNNVGVNTIMGLSTIKNACLSLDLESNIFQASILNDKTFKVMFKPTLRSIPDTTPLTAHPCIRDLVAETNFTRNEVTECYNSAFKNEVESNITDNADNDQVMEDTENKTEENRVSWLDEQAKSTYAKSFM